MVRYLKFPFLRITAELRSLVLVGFKLTPARISANSRSLISSGGTPSEGFFQTTPFALLPELTLPPGARGGGGGGAGPGGGGGTEDT